MSKNTPIMFHKFFVLCLIYLSLTASISCGGEQIQAFSGELSVEQKHVSSCDDLYICQYNCKENYTNLNCPSGSTILEVQVSEDLNLAFEKTCITQRTDIQMIHDIIHNFKVDIHDAKRKGFVNNHQVSLYKKIVSNRNFHYYWRKFKNLCKHKINGYFLVFLILDTIFSKELNKNFFIALGMIDF